MAYTYTTEANEQFLAKVKIGENYYYLKDAAARRILDTFNNSIVTGTIAESISNEAGTGFATEGIVKSYVDAQVGSINKFDVQVVDSFADLGTATADKMYIIYLVPSTREGISNNVKSEYIVVRSGSEGNYTYAWEKIGDTEIDLSNYLTTAASVAGVTFGNGKAISKADLQTALELGALAYKSSASGSVDDYVTSLNGASYTPAGDITVTKDSGATASYDKTTSVTVTTATAADTGNYTPTGSVTVTPATATAATVTNTGTAYSLTDGGVSQAADTTSAFATAGITAAVSETETLVFSNAATSNAVTASGAVTYTAPTLSGALPTFDTQTVVSGITSASFSGNAVDISATPGYTGTDATVTDAVFSAAFSGTADTITPTLVKGAKTITVS